MIVKTCSKITAEVSQKQIWSLVTDVNNWKIWDKTVDESQIVGKFETGNTFMLKPKGGGKITIAIEEAIPLSYFRDLTKFPLARMTGEHWYEETPEGLKICITMTMKGLFSKLWYRIVMKDIVENLEADIENQIRSAKTK